MVGQLIVVFDTWNQWFLVRVSIWVISHLAQTNLIENNITIWPYLEIGCHSLIDWTKTQSLPILFFFFSFSFSNSIFSPLSLTKKNSYHSLEWLGYPFNWWVNLKPEPTLTHVCVDVGSTPYERVNTWQISVLESRQSQSNLLIATYTCLDGPAFVKGLRSSYCMLRYHSLLPFKKKKKTQMIKYKMREKKLFLLHPMLLEIKKGQFSGKCPYNEQRRCSVTFTFTSYLLLS